MTRTPGPPWTSSREAREARVAREAQAARTARKARAAREAWAARTARRTRAAEETAAGDRAVFRAWVRAHHPDAGGDPAEFAEGLRRMRAAPRARTRAPVVVEHRRRGPLARLARWRERRRRARRLL